MSTAIHTLRATEVSHSQNQKLLSFAPLCMCKNGNLYFNFTQNLRILQEKLLLPILKTEVFHSSGCHFYIRMSLFQFTFQFRTLCVLQPPNTAAVTFSPKIAINTSALIRAFFSYVPPLTQSLNSYHFPILSRRNSIAFFKLTIKI